MKFRNFTYLVITLISALILSACDQQKSTTNNATNDKKEIIVGFPPSMHNVLMEKVAKPELEKLGYKVTLKNFGSLRDSNTALVEGSIDLNAAQHQAYLDVYKKETGNDLVSLVHIPSIPAGVFSIKHSTIDQVGAQQTVLMPNDPSNAARAYNLLQELNWIKLKADINPANSTKNDIIENKYNLAFKEVDSALIPRMLNEVDFGVMPGGYAWMSKIDAKHILYQEKLSPELELMVVVKKGNENTQWAKDVKKVYQSAEMKKFIEEDPEVKGRFIFPQQ